MPDGCSSSRTTACHEYRPSSTALSRRCSAIGCGRGTAAMSSFSPLWPARLSAAPAMWWAGPRTEVVQADPASFAGALAAEASRSSRSTSGPPTARRQSQLRSPNPGPSRWLGSRYRSCHGALSTPSFTLIASHRQISVAARSDDGIKRPREDCSTGERRRALKS